MTTLRERLRALPDFPADLPDFDPSSAPAEAAELFEQWLDHALAHGVLQPHACALATADATGVVTARTVILKDLQPGRWMFAGSRSTRKGADIAANPRAALVFFWRELGRQVRVTGTVAELPVEWAREDWNARPATTGEPDPDWRLWAIDAEEVEFWQARHDRRHVRHWYSR